MTRPKRILLLDTGNEWGGGTNSMFELLKRIDRSRFDVTCLFYRDYPKGRDSCLSAELAAIGIPLVLMPQRRQPLWAKLAKELARGVLAWHPDLRTAAVRSIEQGWRVRPNAQRLMQYLQDGGFDLLYMNNQPRSNLEGYLAADRTGVPVVQHCRIEPVMDPQDVALVNRVARKVIGVSNGVVEALVRAGVQPEKCMAVLNGIDPTQPLPDGAPTREDLGLADRDVVFGAVGQLTERKGLRYLLQATARLVEQGLPVRLLLVGDGPQRAELEALTTRLGLQSHVVFTGFQTQPLPYTAAMDVCVLASQSEGLPRVLLEAMLLGKPVIATRVVGSRELVDEGITGRLVPFADPVGLAEAMAVLCRDPALRQRMGQAGRARVLEHYTIDRYVRGVEAILEKAAR